MRNTASSKSAPCTTASLQSSLSRSRALLSIPLALVLQFGGWEAHAQAGQAITGQVTDPLKAVIPGVDITVHNRDTGVDLHTTSTGSGDYAVPYLMPGNYDVTAEKQGFQKQTKTGLVLDTDKSINVNFELVVGSVTNTVTVQQDELTLDTVKADLSNTIEAERITELPTNGRNALTLTELTPGVTWNQGYGAIEPYNTGFYAVNINHGAIDLNLDGSSNMTFGFQSPAYLPPVDAVQEFTVTTSQYDASFGHGYSGSIDMTLKSGTNSFHGTAYEYGRRTWMDANSWENNFYGDPRAPHKQDQYGLQVSGPVRIPKVYDGRNRSFYLVSFQNEDASVPNPVTTSVPDPAWFPKCAGCPADFSDLTYWNGTANVPVTVYDPATIHADATGTLVRDPFPGNIIPGSRINPVAVNIVSYYPAPNVAPRSGQTYYSNNYQVNSEDKNTFHNILSKWDQVITQRDRVALRWGFFQNFNPLNFSGLPDTNPAQWGWLPAGVRYNTFGATYTHVFSPTKLLNITASAAANQNYQVNGHDNFDQAASLGLPAYASPQASLLNRFPEVNAGGFVQLGSTQGFNYSSNSLTILPSFTWVKQKHNIRFGADLRVDQRAVKQNYGGMAFSTDESWTRLNYLTNAPVGGPAYSGNSIASLFLGDLTPSFNGVTSQIQVNPNYFLSDHYDAIWIQDDWKVTSKLTLNIGFRLDSVAPAVDRYNKFNSIFNLASVNPVSAQVGVNVRGGLTFAGVNGQSRSFLPRESSLWQPRLGIAYAVTPKTVIRVGAGKTYTELNIFSTNGQLGFSSTTNLVYSLDAGRTPYANLSNPFPNGITPITGASEGALTGLGQSISWYNPKAKWATNYAYTAGIEQKLTSHDTLSMSYVGDDTVGEWEPYNFNALPLPVYQSCNVDLYGPQAQKNCNPPASSYVRNPFYQIAPFQGTNLYTAPTVNPLTLAVPYPAYGALTGTGYLHNGRGWQNALQVVETHRFENSLSGQATWAWTKLMDSGGFLDQVYQVKSRTIDSSDIAHRVTLSGVWMLPVGRGRTYLGSTNRLLDTLIGGWELGSIYIFESGKPWFFNSGAAYPSSAFVKRQNISVGNIEGIRGASPCLAIQDPTTGVGEPGVAALAAGCSSPHIVYKAAYTVPTNTVYSGIRLGWNNEFDENLSKNFTLKDRLKLQTRMDVFNVLNHPEWQNSYDTANDSNFGSFLKGPQNQSNPARQLQLSVTVKW